MTAKVGGHRALEIASWNINGLNRRLPLLLDWLAAAKPDIVALQETKSTDAAFPRQALEAAGYGALFAGEKTWNGIALLARDADPVPVRRALPGDAADLQCRYLEAAIHGVLVASIYLPNGNPQPGPKFAYKMAWFARLIEHAKSLWDSGLPVALIGDFNVVPTDADLYRTTSYRDNALLHPEARDAYARLLAQGWTDAIRICHPGEAIYTFWDTRRNRWPRDAGLRIDHLLLSAGLASRLADAGVDREMRGAEGASDHAPVRVRLR
ncbi:MAG: exodeoxyribonuclease III [Burkholderiaceae bacterium]